MRIAILSDTHLTPRAPLFVRNTEAACAWSSAIAADAVVHLGDVTAHGVIEEAEMQFAQAALARVQAPLFVVPGNHDVGDDAAQAHGEPALSTERLEDFRRAFGPDCWVIETPHWQVLGLNTQLFGSGVVHEEKQWQWLDTELERCDRHLGIMLHKPLFRDGPEDTVEHVRYVPAGIRRTLWSRLRRCDLRFVAAGHTHQLRQLRVDEVEQVWVPSTSYRIPDRLQEPIGRKVVGTMVLELNAQDHSFAFVTPPGVQQNDLSDHLGVYPELAEKYRRFPDG